MTTDQPRDVAHMHDALVERLLRQQEEDHRAVPEETGNRSGQLVLGR